MEWLKKVHNRPEINSGSMADVAFLLLMFFLVTTQIVEEQGILVKLPAWENEPPEPISIADNRILSVLINAQDAIMIEGAPVDINRVRSSCKEYIKNPSGRKDFPAHPREAVVTLKNDRSTHYAAYLEVYNELLAAYHELRQEEAQKIYGLDYEKLNAEQQKKINTTIPIVISEVETDFTYNN